MTFYKEPNFKETALGQIPKNWNAAKVEDLGEVITGTTPSTFVKEYWNGECPFVTPTDMTESKYVKKTQRKITEKGLQKGRLIPKDSVLVTCIASVGKIALASEPCVTNQQINALICKKEVDPHYVYYATAFRSNILRTWAGRTTNRIVKKSLFEKFPLALPKDVNEQLKIAEVLSAVDEAIQKTNEVIGKTERLKKGLMQELLTKGIGHKEFKDTEIGRIPKKWRVVQIKDIADVKGGKRVPKGQKLVDYETPYPYIRVVDFKNMGVDTSNLKYLPTETYASIKRYTISSGDVYISIAGTIGLAGLIPKELDGANLTENAAKLCNLKDVAKEFLTYVLNGKQAQDQITALVGKAQQPKLALFRIEKIRIPLPPIGEQQKIAEVLFTVDKKLGIERGEKAKLERIKQGLMDLLLNGRIRAKV